MGEAGEKYQMDGMVLTEFVFFFFFGAGSE